MRLFSLALLAAFPACAQLEAWRGLSEEDFHSNTYASYDGAAGELLAPCSKGGRLRLPKPCSKDYKLTKRDLAAFERGMNSVKRYADITAALDDGYLPVPRGFITSQGMLLAHPDLLRDGIYSLDRPDILTYIKKKDTRLWRLSTWVLLYNPEGLFAELNPMVDFMDRSQKFGPLCPKR